jgi:hypothetical protein
MLGYKCVLKLYTPMLVLPDSQNDTTQEDGIHAGNKTLGAVFSPPQDYEISSSSCNASLQMVDHTLNHSLQRTCLVCIGSCEASVGFIVVSSCSSDSFSSMVPFDSSSPCNTHLHGFCLSYSACLHANPVTTYMDGIHHSVVAWTS